jgi:DNA-binding response OmpR family regulator
MADKKKILLIDDDPDIIDSIKAVLQKSGFEVITAENAKDGIESAVSNKPDLILCDMMMERVDAGSKVAEELGRKGLKAPIFLLSSIGSATASNIELDKLGFRGVFQKPVNPDHMITAIKRTLDIK